MLVTDGFLIMLLLEENQIKNIQLLWKKPNLVNVIFKDKVHFDIQNPIIGSLATQVSNNEKAIFEEIKRASSTKGVTISERLEKFKKFNN